MSGEQGARPWRKGEHCFTQGQQVLDANGVEIAWIRYNAPAVVEAMIGSGAEADAPAPTAAPETSPDVITDDQWKTWGADPCARRLLALLTEEVASFEALREEHLRRGRSILLSDPDEAAWLGKEAREMDAFRRHMEGWREAVARAADGNPVVGTLPMAEPPPESSASGPAGECGR